MLYCMEKGKVHLLPGLFKERSEVNRGYLLDLELQGLLQNFYLEAGIVMPDLQVLENPETAKLHWGRRVLGAASYAASFMERS